MKWDYTQETSNICSDNEMKDFLKTIDFTVKLEKHISKKGKTQYNVVFYFTPFTGKYLNYMRRWEARTIIIDSKGYRKGPNSRGLYIGLKWRPYEVPSNKRYIQNPIRQGYKKYYKTPYELKKESTSNYWRWHFRGTNTSKYKYYSQSNRKTMYSATSEYYRDGRFKSASRTAFNYYKDFYPLLATDAQKGYKIIPLPDLITVVGDKFQMDPNQPDRRGFIGHMTGLNGILECYTSNFYWGKYLYEKQNTEY